MANQTANRPVPNILQASPYAGGGYIINALVGATEEIYKGAFVTLDSGDKYLGAMTVPDPLYGLALDRVTGGSSNGDNTCRVLCAAVVQHAVASAAVANIGQPAYATDDQTLVLTHDGTDTPIGIIVGVPSAVQAIIQMFAPRIEVPVFTITNYTADWAYAADAAAPVAEDAVSTLIRNLINMGLIQGTTAA